MADTEGSIFEKSVNPYGMIKRVVAVMSGKGGVGKSSVTALLAAELRRRGLAVGILDADVTGPSIPKLFGLKGRAGHNGVAMEPLQSAGGVKVISINLLLEQEDQPVIWRGPLVAGVVKQFFAEVDWGDLDYLLVDLPPGTGDVPLTTMQSLPLDGMIVVSSPQELVELIVKKAVHMAEQMRTPILGMVENYSYLECPDCHRRIDLFGPSRAEAVAADFGLALLGRLPLVPEVATLADAGRIEAVAEQVPEFFAPIAAQFLAKLPAKA
ncbi:Mrp family chromosome partitioning ATPase [Hydrogenispora ethanolica]|uniref:Iron-sulfur cluster carrier protein n=1 Tax=Hydrogenispora ethanolica TaxID=1082276 RepID=A0A4R1SC24_HYDET|nr:Mrp/NBP35 family ATP-binding protein [Hydrogenispora ethanolica]TCL76989.1 Mrp family chromosome partitioning ATPase [Hydrogenispora ethanolica]